jgi:hypothetical protein
VYITFSLGLRNDFATKQEYCKPFLLQYFTEGNDDTMYIFSPDSWFTKIMYHLPSACDADPNLFTWQVDLQIGMITPIKAARANCRCL